MAHRVIKMQGGAGARLSSSLETAGRSLRMVILEPPIPRSQAWVFSKKRGKKILRFGKFSNFSGKKYFYHESTLFCSLNINECRP